MGKINRHGILPHYDFIGNQETDVRCQMSGDRCQGTDVRRQRKLAARSAGGGGKTPAPKPAQSSKSSLRGAQRRGNPYVRLSTRRSNPNVRMNCRGPAALAMTTGETSGHKIPLPRRGIRNPSTPPNLANSPKVVIARSETTKQSIRSQPLRRSPPNPQSRHCSGCATRQSIRAPIDAPEQPKPPHGLPRACGPRNDASSEERSDEAIHTKPNPCAEACQILKVVIDSGCATRQSIRAPIDAPEQPKSPYGLPRACGPRNDDRGNIGAQNSPPSEGNS
jgi:hypothetical protein